MEVVKAFIKTFLITLGVISLMAVAASTASDASKPMREFVEKHCRVVIKTGATFTNTGNEQQIPAPAMWIELNSPVAEQTWGQIKCDQ